MRRAEGYRSPGDHYTGGTPGARGFIEWVLAYVLDSSEAEAERSWRRTVTRSPQQATAELFALARMIEHDPPDLVDIVNQYGATRLYQVKKNRRVPYGQREYRDWLHNRFRVFDGIFAEITGSGTAAALGPPPPSAGTPQPGWRELLTQRPDLCDVEALDTATLVAVADGGAPEMSGMALESLCVRSPGHGRHITTRLLMAPRKDAELRARALCCAVSYGWLPHAMPRLTWPKAGARLVGLLDDIAAHPAASAWVDEDTRWWLRTSVPLGRIHYWLRAHWMENTYEQVAARWRTHANRYALMQDLTDMDEVLADPPPDLPELLARNAWLSSWRLHEAGLRGSPTGTGPTPAEAVAWLRWARNQLAAVLRSPLPAHPRGPTADTGTDHRR